MMMDLLIGSAAFLIRDGCYLLEKRAPNRKLFPGLWGGVGGKMEPDELNDPLRTCLREIKEETGITPDKIQNLALRYIITRLAGSTVRQSYIFFGETNAEELTETDEGELFWIPKGELLDRKFSATFALMLEHYVKTPDSLGRIVAGTACNDNGALRMAWHVLEDYE
jgi:8-oxo-dGTP diphosphatase